MEQARIVKSAAEMRTLARRREWHGTTAGHCPAFQQANLVILPSEAAPEFADANGLSARHSQLAISTDAGDDTPETLHVRLAGRMRHARLSTRWQAPRR